MCVCVHVCVRVGIGLKPGSMSVEIVFYLPVLAGSVYTHMHNPQNMLFFFYYYYEITCLMKTLKKPV